VIRVDTRLSRQLRYDVWANEETLRALGQAEPPPRSLRWMAHIIGAEFLWLARMRGEGSKLAVWPDLSLAQCREAQRELSAALLNFNLDELGPLDRRVSYVNSKGEPWSSTVEDILTHVVIHSAYHRGQIAADMRTAGQEPAYTDYIHAARQGHVK
jgi:uncharacterized damage-inducible protein DinB